MHVQVSLYGLGDSPRDTFHSVSRVDDMIINKDMHARVYGFIGLRKIAVFMRGVLIPARFTSLEPPEPALCTAL